MATQLTRRGLFRWLLAAAGLAAARCYAPRALAAVAAPASPSVWTVRWQESLPAPSWFSLGDPLRMSKAGPCTAETESGWAP
jgi:hypothetical protein